MQLAAHKTSERHLSFIAHQFIFKLIYWRWECVVDRKNWKENILAKQDIDTNSIR
jgi:hypothetical protein